MANPPCMSDDGNAAVFVGTMLATGDAVALCDECLVGWAAALLNVMTGVDPTPFIQAISDTPPDAPAVEADVPFEPAAATDEGDEAPPMPVRRGRTPRGSPTAGADSDPNPDAAVPATADAPPAA